MTIGTSIFVIAIGAIMTFAVRTDLGWLDVQTAGGVLMVTGLVMLGITFTMWSRRRRRATVTEDASYRNGHPTPVQEPIDRTPN